MANHVKSIQDPGHNDIRKVKGTLEHLLAREGDVVWLLKLLYCLDPTHLYFKKGYRYKKLTNITHKDKVAAIPNPNNHFDDLPMLNTQELKKN